MTPLAGSYLYSYIIIIYLYCNLYPMSSRYSVIQQLFNQTIVYILKRFWHILEYLFSWIFDVYIVSWYILTFSHELILSASILKISWSQIIVGLQYITKLTRQNNSLYEIFTKVTGRSHISVINWNFLLPHCLIWCNWQMSGMALNSQSFHLH